MKGLILGLAVMLAGSAAMAQDAGLRLLNHADEARLWSGVGRVNIGEGGFCTGALIEPQLVLTAAHCFFDPEGGRIDASEVRFAAGWNSGIAQSLRSARRVMIDPDYVAGDVAGPGKVLNDLALIELDQPVSNAIHPFDRQAAPKVGDIVSVVSYAADRSEIPSIEDSCSVLFTEEDVLVLSCSVNFGSSGAPIFVTTDARPKIASVVVAMTEYEGRQVSLAVGLDGSLDMLVNRLKQTDPVFVSRKPGMTTLADQLGRSQTASPFVGVP